MINEDERKGFNIGFILPRFARTRNIQQTDITHFYLPEENIHFDFILLQIEGGASFHQGSASQVFDWLSTHPVVLLQGDMVIVANF